VAAVRLLLPVLAVVLLGASLTRLRPEPATVHVRWTVHYWDLTASVFEDVPAGREPEANSELFTRNAQRAPDQTPRRVRIVVAGRTIFDRALTRDELRRLGDVSALHVANDVRFAGLRDLAADGTALLQYRASPPGYRIVDAYVAPEFALEYRRKHCDRKGSFELERSASHAGTTARVVQRGASFRCNSIRPTSATVEITSPGRTPYTSRLTMGGLSVTNGPAFVDFERTGAPSIALTGSDGNAYCCYRTHIFYPSGARAYRQAVHRWGDRQAYPALLRDGGAGAILFVSSIDDFGWMIGVRNAVAPVQIFAFGRGRFRNVTPDYPAVVREQADHLWARAGASLRAGKFVDAYPGVIAYLVDMSAIGHSAEAWRNARAACTAGDCEGYFEDLRSVLREVKVRANSNHSHK
jgi:hypothetical protein